MHPESLGAARRKLESSPPRLAESIESGCRHPNDSPSPWGNSLKTTQIATLLSLTTLVTAQENDTFEGDDNDGGWSFNVTVPDILETTGGNPAGYLHNPGVDSFAPIPTTDDATPSAFQGNYRAMGVTDIRVDAITHSASFGAAGREFSILLRDTKDTPDVTDDDYAYYVGPLVPQVGEGWKSFSFAIPSQSTDAVPPGWSGGGAEISRTSDRVSTGTTSSRASTVSNSGG